MDTLAAVFASGSARVTMGDPGRSRCCCPATSPSEIGRIRTASGVWPDISGDAGLMRTRLAACADIPAHSGHGPAG
ncbi:hypothetical protein GCM10023171_12190 [Microbacterium panaciterrae]|uniref:Membrane protein insertion efficiency factor YidD n=1 Tax=Microbacterium panaciterrae TaxID=985759 RepID=A0ABP8P8S7_9MICO